MQKTLTQAQYRERVLNMLSEIEAETETTHAYHFIGPSAPHYGEDLFTYIECSKNSLYIKAYITTRRSCWGRWGDATSMDEAVL